MAPASVVGAVALLLCVGVCARELYDWPYYRPYDEYRSMYNLPWNDFPIEIPMDRVGLDPLPYTDLQFPHFPVRDSTYDGNYPPGCGPNGAGQSENYMFWVADLVIDFVSHACNRSTHWVDDSANMPCRERYDPTAHNPMQGLPCPARRVHAKLKVGYRHGYPEMRTGPNKTPKTITVPQSMWAVLVVDGPYPKRLQYHVSFDNMSNTDKFWVMATDEPTATYAGNNRVCTYEGPTYPPWDYLYDHTPLGTKQHFGTHYMPFGAYGFKYPQFNESYDIFLPYQLNGFKDFEWLIRADDEVFNWYSGQVHNSVYTAVDEHVSTPPDVDRSPVDYSYVVRPFFNYEEVQHRFYPAMPINSEVVYYHKDADCTNTGQPQPSLTIRTQFFNFNYSTVDRWGMAEECTKIGYKPHGEDHPDKQFIYYNPYGGNNDLFKQMCLGDEQLGLHGSALRFMMDRYRFPDA